MRYSYSQVSRKDFPRVDELCGVADMLAFSKVNLTDKPTLISTALGAPVFIRRLPYPYDHLSVTHTGIVFDHRLLKWATTEDIAPCCLRPHSTFDYKFNTYIDTVLLPPHNEHPFHTPDHLSMSISVPIYRIVAGVYVPNPKGYNDVTFLNGIVNDYHFQNLLWCDDAGI